MEIVVQCVGIKKQTTITGAYWEATFERGTRMDNSNQGAALTEKGFTIRADVELPYIPSRLYKLKLEEAK